MEIPTVEITTGTRICEITFKGRRISLILPDTNMLGYEENNFIDSKHATKLSKQIFKYNNESIGIAQSYEEDLKDRKDVINMIKENVTGIPSDFLKSMKRSLVAHAYHREKRIRQTESNNPLGIIRKLTTVVLFTEETDDLIRERKSKDAAAVFDRTLNRLFKKYLRPYDESLKIKMGGVNMLKDGYEYYIAKAIENLFKAMGLKNIGDISSLESIVRIALIQKQNEVRKTRIQNTLLSSDIEKIINEPIISLEESIKLYINN